MIKQEIIDKISKYFKLTHFEAEKIYDDMFQGIIQGVKEDNIADITNLGEFIIKYNNNGDNTHKKTVEFLPTLSLEEEINQRGYEEHRTYTPSPFTEKPENVKEEIRQEIKHTEEKASGELTDEKANVEDEIRKKREEILSKITAPKEETKSTTTTTEIKETVVTPLIIPAVVSTTQEIFNEVKQTEIKETEIKVTKEEITEKTADFNDIKKPEVEEIHEKSFSDYFTEVKEEKTVSDAVNKTIIPPVENVIPPTAVELHNQITGDQANKNINYQTTVTPPPYANGNGNGNGSEHIAQDNSYYIWYKDSEPNVNDTQTMSYEYELLYQATKEAEYKSKLRIYVTTFILFFSVVLLLLILSPVIYKYFFTPGENQQTEEVQQETSSNGVEPKQEEPNSQPNNQASPENSNTQNNNTPPVTENNTQQNNTQPVQEQPKQEQPKQEQPKQEQPKQETQQPVTQPQQTPKVDGITKNAMGWMDEKNRVIYVQLDNGKFTIQESAWDSDAKANKRLGVVGGIVPGLKGNVVKVDLGAKGTWFRARFGEFATLEEAKSKAEELRTKERTKLQALLLSFLLYT